MTKPTIRKLLTLACFLISLPVQALDLTRPIDLYSLDVWRAGLPQYTVQAVAQDANGYLWLGTFEGLVRFNGIRFEVFDEQTVPTVSNWQVRAICRDRAGTLWVGKLGGGLLTYRNGRFAVFKGEKPLPNEAISALLASPDGSVWVGTRGGLARIRGQRVDSWTVATGLPHSNVTSIAEQSDSSIVVGTDGGMARVAGDGLQPFPLKSQALQPRVTALTVARDGSLWIGTLAGGLFRIRQQVQSHFGGETGLPAASITSILEDRDGSIWVGTAPGGLSRLRGGRFELLDIQRGLPNASVRTLFEDREGSIWIGTNGGLARLKDLKFVNYTRRNGLSEENVRVVNEEADGSLWVGTYGGGLNRIKDGVVTVFSTEQGLSDPYVRTLSAGTDGTLWIGTGNGLDRLREGRLTGVGAKEGLAGERVDAILVRRDQRVIVVTDTGGVQELRGGRFVPLLSPSEPVIGCRVVFEDKAGRLWLGTADAGLYEIEGGRIVRHWTRAEGLPSNAIYALHEAVDGLWIGTRGGLCRLRNEAVQTVNARQGLSHPVIFNVIDDGVGSFWLTSNRGLTRLDRASVVDVMEGRASRVRETIFTTADGLASEQCNGATQPAGVKLRNGQLAIPTVSGLSLVSPENLHRNGIPPPIQLTDIFIDGRRFDPAARISLPWSSRRFEFRFDAPSLLVPDLVAFQYRVDGFDKEWIDSEGRRLAMYNSLPPGRHRFRVRSLNNDKVMSKAEASFAFQIPLPPWFRWWALLAYLTILALIVIIIIRLREHSLIRENLELEEKIRSRTAQLNQANLHLERLSITDSLTGLANRRHFDDILSVEWNRARRSGQPLSLAIVDIDHFKLLNDTYGHQAGDDCLRRVTATLSETLSRATDLVARWGGEEFVVLLPDCQQTEALANGERLRSKVAGLAIPHAASPTVPVVTVSIGVTTIVPREGISSDEIIRSADNALYRAKQLGRNRVASESEEDPPRGL